MSDVAKIYDCIVCGSCVIDMLCRPVDLDTPIGRGVLHEIEPMLLTGGGIVSNSGITMARMGMKVAAFSYVGDDAWGPVVRGLYESAGVDTSPLMTHDTLATSTTVVAIDASGERSFLHTVGAPKSLNAQAFLDRMDLFASSKFVLLGYYSLMPNLQDDLPGVLEAMRRRGVRTAMDAAGTGGGMEPLASILPHLDVYVPSHAEACHQTGISADDDPRKIIERYRACDAGLGPTSSGSGAPALLGVKLGKAGVLLSERDGEYIQVPIVDPPGDVIDTTGAGDSFYAGLLTGLIKGMSVADAGRLGTAAGACCVTSVGGCTGGRDYAQTARLAGFTG